VDEGEEKEEAVDEGSEEGGGKIRRRDYLVVVVQRLFLLAQGEFHQQNVCLPEVLPLLMKKTSLTVYRAITAFV
jgi:hypothetical protein